jgi:hypothetical protein
LVGQSFVMPSEGGAYLERVGPVHCPKALATARLVHGIYNAFPEQRGVDGDSRESRRVEDGRVSHSIG